METVQKTVVDWQRAGRALTKSIGGRWARDTAYLGDELPWSFKLVCPDKRMVVVVTQSQLPPVMTGGLLLPIEWVHASMSQERRVPTYEELKALKDAVFGPDLYAYQVFPAEREHVNLHSFALHLWGRADGSPVLPTFGAAGTI